MATSGQQHGDMISTKRKMLLVTGSDPGPVVCVPLLSAETETETEMSADPAPLMAPTSTPTSTADIDATVDPFVCGDNFFIFLCRDFFAFFFGSIHKKDPISFLLQLDRLQLGLNRLLGLR